MYVFLHFSGSEIATFPFTVTVGNPRLIFLFTCLKWSKLWLFPKFVVTFAFHVQFHEVKHMSHLRIMTLSALHDLSGIMSVCCIAEYYMLSKYVSTSCRLAMKAPPSHFIFRVYDHVKMTKVASSMRPDLL